MSITQVHKAINRHLRTMTVDVFQSESYVNGEQVAVYATGVSKTLAVFPLSNRDMQFLPDGAYTFQDRKIYELGTGTLIDKSILNFDGDKYLIKGGTKRNFEGGFTTYMSKRIAENE